MVMEGFLQKRLSLLQGYKEQWFVLTDDGYLKYFSVRTITLITNKLAFIPCVL